MTVTQPSPTLVRTPIAGRIVGGALCILIALAIFMWARSHSPHMGLGQMLSNPDNYMINEPFYSVINFVAAGLGLAGLLIIALALRAPTYQPVSAPVLVDFQSLREGLSSSDPRHRERCVFAIGDMGARAEDAVSDLERLRTDPDRRVRTRVQWALESIARATRR